MRTKAALWGRDLIEVLIIRPVQTKTDEKALSLIIFALEGNLFGYIPDFDTELTGMEKLESHYAIETMVKRC